MLSIFSACMLHRVVWETFSGMCQNSRVYQVYKNGIVSNVLKLRYKWFEVTDRLNGWFSWSYTKKFSVYYFTNDIKVNEKYSIESA